MLKCYDIRSLLYLPDLCFLYFHAHCHELEVFRVSLFSLFIHSFHLVSFDAHFIYTVLNSLHFVPAPFYRSGLFERAGKHNRKYVVFVIVCSSCDANCRQYISYHIFSNVSNACGYFLNLSAIHVTDCVRV